MLNRARILSIAFKHLSKTKLEDTPLGACCEAVQGDLYIIQRLLASDCQLDKNQQSFLEKLWNNMLPDILMNAGVVFDKDVVLSLDAEVENWEDIDRLCKFKYTAPIELKYSLSNVSVKSMNKAHELALKFMRSEWIDTISPNKFGAVLICYGENSFEAIKSGVYTNSGILPMYSFLNARVFDLADLYETVSIRDDLFKNGIASFLVMSQDCEALSGF